VPVCDPFTITLTPESGCDNSSVTLPVIIPDPVKEIKIEARIIIAKITGLFFMTLIFLINIHLHDAKPGKIP